MSKTENSTLYLSLTCFFREYNYVENDDSTNNSNYSSVDISFIYR